MAKKNTIKKYIQGGYYHIYNKGIDGKTIFVDDEDYQQFLNYLVFYLAPFEDFTKEGFKKDRPSIVAHKQTMNLASQISLLAFCLMPDHFHLLLRQEIDGAIAKMVRRVCIQYSMYFNKKYQRRGPLFEGVYKAVQVKTTDQVLHVSRYIHLNPLRREVYKIGPVRMRSTSDPGNYAYSSYKYYNSGNNPIWLNCILINEISGYKYSQFISESEINFELIYPQLLLDI